MKVTLVNYTPHALETLIFTKNTRLRLHGAGLEEILNWPMSKKLAELEYMKNTIQSSWEFADYLFAIEDVTRAFTHQLVRHRVGTSFAQQAQRVVNMEGFGYLATGQLLAAAGEEPSESYQTHSGDLFEMGSRLTDYATESAPHQPDKLYEIGMDAVNAVYSALVANGVKSQDARGILPTNILTNIVFKANLRTLHEMALKRLCVKAQGEFQDVFRAIVDAVAEVHPWAEAFLRVQCAWNGTCLFPSLPVDECHVKPFVYDAANAMSYGQSSGTHPEAHVKPTEQLYQIHRLQRVEIQPVVK